jgi:hypothetical protein
MIEVKEDKLQKLEEASQVIERIREQISYMNADVIADFDILSSAVTSLFEEHNLNKKLAFIGRNANFDHFRERLGLTAYLSIQDLVSVEFPDRKEQSMAKPFGFVKTIKIKNHTMILDCNLNWGEIWTYSSHMIDTIFPGRLVCIDEIKRISDKDDYDVIVNVF